MTGFPTIGALSIPVAALSAAPSLPSPSPPPGPGAGAMPPPPGPGPLVHALVAWVTSRPWLAGVALAGLIAWLVAGGLAARWRQARMVRGAALVGVVVPPTVEPAGPASSGPPCTGRRTGCGGGGR